MEEESKYEHIPPKSTLLPLKLLLNQIKEESKYQKPDYSKHDYDESINYNDYISF